MRVGFAFVSGLLAGALLIGAVEGCGNLECTDTVYELASGRYRLSNERDTPNDSNYELTYSKDEGTVIETFSRAGRAVRNEYTASPAE